jgi:hypothetical protein
MTSDATPLIILYYPFLCADVNLGSFVQEDTYPTALSYSFSLYIGPSQELLVNNW